MDTLKPDSVRKRATIIASSDARCSATVSSGKRSSRHALGLVLGVWLCVGVIGCANVGPTTLSQGRPAYNAVLSETNAEQALAYVVKMRYGESASLLSVATINATVRFRSNAAIEAGVGPDQNYAGNLVPLSGGVAYEDTPTITYVPAQGAAHMRSLLSPIPSDLLVPLLNNTQGMGNALSLLVERINGIPNPAFRFGIDTDRDQRFVQIAQHFQTLNRAGVLKFVQAANDKAQFILWLRDYQPAYTEDVSEFLALLDISGVTLDGGDVLLPLKREIHRPGMQSITITSYSVYELAKMLAFSVDLPPEDHDLAWAVEKDQAGFKGPKLSILRAKNRPSNTAAETQYRGWWFYVDGTDQQTKFAFTLLNALIAARTADASAGMSVAPALTVPVGGQ